MFTECKAVFFYCVSPVHMGAGSAVGVIDNPIQREKHSDHPVFAGSGLKGALRHSFESLGGDPRLINRIFGPDTNASDHAGAISFGDAQLVAFPIRSLRGGFVYATCPYALARLKRLLTVISKGKAPDWSVPAAPAAGTGCTVLNDGLLANGSLHLEVFQFTHDAAGKDALTKIAAWLSTSGLPADDSYDYFRNKLKTDLVLLSDEDFKYFVQNATTVEPHVRIDPDTGTADGGGLFYTENLPPESLLVAPLMASDERTPKDKRNGQDLTAGDVLDKITNALHCNGGLLQVGGDATTGRGLVVAHVLNGKEGN
ncbi:MAG: type III-B CRISPR module RAMP protein Cmr4 [Pseudomonadota bacterium]